MLYEMGEKTVEENNGPPDDIGENLFESSGGMSPNSAFAHLYRGEVHRMKLWRQRMDRTTHWAIISLFGILTWVFSNANRPHYLLLFGVIIMSIFMVIEGRRYKGYEMWHQRMRKLQKNVFSSGFDASSQNEDNWQQKLADSYKKPSPNITTSEAVMHRFQRVYAYLISILLMSWFINVFVIASNGWKETASIGIFDGIYVLFGVLLVSIAVVFAVLYPYDWSSDEELL